MKQLPVGLSAALLTAVLLVGCSPNPPPQSPGSGDPSSGQPAFEVTERFSLDTGIKDSEGKPEGTLGIAISADGKLALAIANGKSGNVQVWDLEHRKKLYEHDSENGSMLPVAISPDGKLGAYSAQESSSIALIELTSGKQLRRLRKKGDEPLYAFTTGLAFSAKGRTSGRGLRQGDHRLGPGHWGRAFRLDGNGEGVGLVRFLRRRE
jgi:WD40 repeat protein